MSNAASRRRQRTEEVQEKLKGMGFDDNNNLVHHHSQPTNSNNMNNIATNFQNKHNEIYDNNEKDGDNHKEYPPPSRTRRRSSRRTVSSSSIASSIVIAAASKITTPFIPEQHVQRPNTMIESSKGGFLCQIIFDTPPGHGERMKIVVGKTRLSGKREKQKQMLKTKIDGGIITTNRPEGGKIETGYASSSILPEKDSSSSSSTSSDQIDVSQKITNETEVLNDHAIEVDSRKQGNACSSDDEENKTINKDSKFSATLSKDSDYNDEQTALVQIPNQLSSSTKFEKNSSNDRIEMMNGDNPIPTTNHKMEVKKMPKDANHDDEDDIVNNIVAVPDNNVQQDSVVDSDIIQQTVQATAATSVPRQIPSNNNGDAAITTKAIVKKSGIDESNIKQSSVIPKAAIITTEQQSQQKNQDEEEDTNNHLSVSALQAASNLNQSPSLSPPPLPEKNGATITASITKQQKEEEKNLQCDMKKEPLLNFSQQVNEGKESLTMLDMQETSSPVTDGVIPKSKAPIGAKEKKKTKRKEYRRQEQKPSSLITGNDDTVKESEEIVAANSPSKKERQIHIEDSQKKVQKKKKKKPKASGAKTAAAAVASSFTTTDEKNNVPEKSNSLLVGDEKKTSSTTENQLQSQEKAKELHQSQLKGKKKQCDATDQSSKNNSKSKMKNEGKASSKADIPTSSLAAEGDDSIRHQLKSDSKLKKSVAIKVNNNDSKAKQKQQNDDPKVSEGGDIEDEQRQIIVGERPAAVRFSPDVSFKQKMTKKGMSRKNDMTSNNAQQKPVEHPMMKFDRELDDIVNSKSNLKLDSSSKQPIRRKIGVRNARKPSSKMVSGKKCSSRTMKREQSFLRGLFTRKDSSKKVEV